MKCCDTEGMRVLLADDEEDFRTMARLVLEDLDFEVQEASSGVEAVRSCYMAAKEGKPFHLVILDLHIEEGFEGDEVVQQITGLKPRPKVLLCTGETSHPMLNYSDSFGFDGVLTKPFTLDIFREEVARLFGPTPR